MNTQQEKDHEILDVVGRAWLKFRQDHRKEYTEKGYECAIVLDFLFSLAPRSWDIHNLKIGQEYWYIESDSSVLKAVYEKNLGDNWRIRCMNCFPNQDSAVKYRHMVMDAPILL